MSLRQAAQQALEALENDAMQRTYAGGVRIANAAIALRAALAEPEQEPVAWGVFDGPNLHDVNFTEEEAQEMMRLKGDGSVVKPLYTAPTPQSKPQTTHWEGCEAVHPECRKQEPMATKQMLRWVEHLKRLSDDGQHMSIPGLSSGACWELAIELEQFIKNTAPTPRKPLTEEEMRECAQAMNAEPLAEGWPELIKFARAIERAHGITGEQHE